jgi:uncharacterized Zn finger protein (UPF0148 family)
MSTEGFNGLFGMDQECPDHGDEMMIECSACGTEFCRGCFPGARTCPTCNEIEEEEKEPDNDDRAASLPRMGGAENLLKEDDLDELLEEADKLGEKEDLDESIEEEG